MAQQGAVRRSERIQRGLVTSEAPLYERDPGAWEAYLAEGNAKQARKRVGADVILQDGVGRLLLVDPKYKPDWDLPGGMAEANEAPHEAARRELREELGLDLRVMGLLCVGVGAAAWPVGRLADVRLQRRRAER